MSSGEICITVKGDFLLFRNPINRQHELWFKAKCSEWTVLTPSRALFFSVWLWNSLFHSERVCVAAVKATTSSLPAPHSAPERQVSATRTGLHVAPVLHARPGQWQDALSMTPRVRAWLPSTSPLLLTKLATFSTDLRPTVSAKPTIHN